MECCFSKILYLKAKYWSPDSNRVAQGERDTHTHAGSERTWSEANTQGRHSYDMIHRRSNIPREKETKCLIVRREQWKRSVSVAVRNKTTRHLRERRGKRIAKYRNKKKKKKQMMMMMRIRTTSRRLHRSPSRMLVLLPLASSPEIPRPYFKSQTKKKKKNTKISHSPPHHRHGFKSPFLFSSFLFFFLPPPSSSPSPTPAASSTTTSSSSSTKTRCKKIGTRKGENQQKRADKTKDEKKKNPDKRDT